MKKIISLLLALTLCLTLAAPAFAAGISGGEYAGEAQAVLEKNQPLAAAIVFERAAQAYQEAGNAELALGAYSSAGEAYEAAGKTAQALRAYLAAKDYGKVTELYQTADLSGDECLAAAAVLAEQGVPASELTVIYKKAAEAFLAEADAEQDTNKALELLQKAQALADKHGDTELAARINAAVEALKGEGSEFQQAVLVLAMNESASDFYYPFEEMLTETLGFTDANEMIERFDQALPYYESAAEHLRLYGYYYQAFVLYYQAANGALEYSLNHSGAPDMQVFALFEKAVECADPAVSQLVEAGDYSIAVNVYTLLIYVHTSFLTNQAAAMEETKKLIMLEEKAAEAALNSGNWSDAVSSYLMIASYYEYYLNDAESAVPYREKAEKVRAENDPNYVSKTGSTLSQGSVAIVAAISSAVIFGFSGFLLGRKKKPATVNSSEEE